MTHLPRSVSSLATGVLIIGSAAAAPWSTITVASITPAAGRRTIAGAPLVLPTARTGAKR